MLSIPYLENTRKSSPMDGTIDNWNYILANEIKDIKELEKEFITEETDDDSI